ncbi:hypothetical protein DMH04_41400 [Kibdelosporangium aridum]|uniref:Uncharacterized protein n=1 Tax=Kibdelosporangium aridum TaxID=2030 RepID=A0A428YUS7_KIBAR|nr:hypothetical protein [Kibdelosporangium aridum]RSM73470.1 hypothetical protein DMH04_41400 [Kibdelosporangium aridum]
MSLAIDVDEITAVLLADGWHTVANKSFTLDSYEFVWRDSTMHGGGQSGVCSAGFEFTDDSGAMLSGPLTAVLAVRRRGNAP